MTLHTAKGLEFDTVFVTGFEEGLFPHERASVSTKELEEERRLAYVGLTRARKRLYVTRAVVRTIWGKPTYNPASRFLGEIPDRLVDWRRLDRLATWAQPAPRPRSEPQGAKEFLARSTTARAKSTLTLIVGDRVLHSAFGLGTVMALTGSGDQVRAEVNFGSLGTKLLSVKHAPLELLKG